MRLTGDMLFRILGASFFALALAFAISPASGETDKLQGLNNPVYWRLDSEILERPLHVYVRLPESYDASGQAYPAIYLLDGGHLFPMLASYYRYLVFGEEIPEAIVIGLSYGADNAEDGNFRSTDYTAPSAERAHFGGAERFRRVLETEIIPEIEKTYRADPARRIIFGQSLGGQFVLYTALTRPDLFWGHIASNPALHRNLAFFLEDHVAGAAYDAKLFVSSGSLDEAQFRGPALAWIARWEAAAEKPWALKTETLEGESHFSAAPASFRAGLKWLFSDAGATE